MRAREAAVRRRGGSCQGKTVFEAAEKSQRSHYGKGTPMYRACGPETAPLLLLFQALADQIRRLLSLLADEPVGRPA